MSFSPLHEDGSKVVLVFSSPVSLFTGNPYETINTLHSEQLADCKAFSRAEKMMGRGERNSL